MPSSVSWGMVVVKHQHGWSAAGSHSAHWLGWPQSGQRDESTGSLMAFPFNDELRGQAGRQPQPRDNARGAGVARG